MNLNELSKKLGYSFTEKATINGSRYYTINGVKFRVSDHNQPSNYVIRDYFDLENEEQILHIVSHELFGFNYNVHSDENGYYKIINDGSDVYYEDITRDEYDQLLKIVNAKKDFFIKNNFKYSF
jgi:hypothetical protein